MKFYATDESFGNYEGPFEADSKQDLVDGMENAFQDWADDWENSPIGDPDERENYLDGLREEYKNQLITESEY